MDGFITYLRTSSEIKSLCSLGFKKVTYLLKSKKINVRLQVFMQQLLIEKKKDIEYLRKINLRLMEWQRVRDNKGLSPAVLVYHHSGARALKGFRYQKISYKKKDRKIYSSERREFSSKERSSFIKTIAVDREKELLSAGFTSKQISIMKSKGRAPIGYEVHHRIPLDDGGDNSKENLILIRNDVEHRSVHGYYNPGELMIKQLEVGETAEVTLPVPPDDAVVYPNAVNQHTCERVPNSTLVELYDDNY